MESKLLILDVGKDSDKGLQRPYNEDSFQIADNQDEIRRFGHLFIVADGVGGESHGGFASSSVAENVKKLYYQYAQQANLPSDELLETAIKQANRELFQKASENNMGGHVATTIVTALLKPNELVIAWVGDSRAYLLPKNGKISQITHDHTKVNRLVEMGQLSPEMAENHPEKNILSRSVGHQAEVEVDLLISHEIAEGDLLLLCSDGLTKHVSDQEIEQRLRKAPDSQSAVKTLIASANQQGGTDNITVVVVHLGKRKASSETIVQPMPKANDNSGDTSKKRNFLLIGSLIVLAVIIIISLIVGLIFGQLNRPSDLATEPSQAIQTTETPSGITNEDIALTETINAVSTSLVLQSTALVISPTSPTELVDLTATNNQETLLARNNALATQTDLASTISASISGTQTAVFTPASPTPQASATFTANPNQQYQDNQSVYTQRETCQYGTVYDSNPTNRCIPANTRVRIAPNPNNGISNNGSNWYSIAVPELGFGVGWIRAEDLGTNPPPPLATTIALDANFTPTNGAIANSTSYYDAPNGTALGQLNAAESVKILGKTADGLWYQVSRTNDMPLGWVSVTAVTPDSD